MGFAVVGIDTIRCQNNLPVSLIGINRGYADTGVRVDSGEDNYVGLQSMEYLVEAGVVESAVPLLDHDRVRGSNRQFGIDLAASCSFDRDLNSFGSHLGERIVQIGIELLTNPNYRMAVLPHDTDEFVDRPDQLLLLRGRPFRKEIIHHVDND